MPVSPEERLVYFLVCDQARSETSNKSLYIGAYGSALIVEGSFPAVLPSLVLVGCLRAVKKKERIKVTIEVPGTDAVSDVHQVEATGPLDTLTLNVNLSPCVLPLPGTLEVTFSFEDGGTIKRGLTVMTRNDYKAARW